MKNKLSFILSKLEIVLAVILFFTMLITCGLYINIKMNGKTSTLPQLSERDKSVLLRSVASESLNYNDDLIEPVFVGIKTGDEMLAAFPEKNTRQYFETLVYNTIYSLFSGNAVKQDVDDKKAYIESLKQNEKYMLISFFDDIPSSVFLACISDNYEIEEMNEFFYVKHLFLLPDENLNLFGVVVSKDYDIYKLIPAQNIEFSKILSETYNISDGYSGFVYDKSVYGSIKPVLTSSFFATKYEIRSLPEVYGKERDAEWISELLAFFSMNHNLVKNYLSKNGSEMNYIDEMYEIVISDDGKVVFSASDDSGIYLDEYLSYLPENNRNYNYYDKIFAVKNLLNDLKFNETSHSYCITGVDYDKQSDILSVYLKSFVDGIMLTDNAYDAKFEIKSNYLIYAEFYGITCSETKGGSVLIPQIHANILAGNNEQVYPALNKDNDSNDIYSVMWKSIVDKSEVAGNGN